MFKVVYYTIAEVSKILCVSKVTIYNKLKTLNKELKPCVKLKQKVKYIDETGLELIKMSLSESKNDLNALNNDLKQDASNFDYNEDLSTLNKLNNDVEMLKSDYINRLKENIKLLEKELEIKNEQLNTKDKLLENFQVLLREEQKNRLLLEEKKESDKKSFWSRFF